MSDYPNNIFAAPSASAKPLKPKKHFSFARQFHHNNQPQQQQLKPAPQDYLRQAEIRVVAATPQMPSPSAPAYIPQDPYSHQYGQPQQQPHHHLHHQHDQFPQQQQQQQQQYQYQHQQQQFQQQQPHHHHHHEQPPQFQQAQPHHRYQEQGYAAQREYDPEQGRFQPAQQREPQQPRRHEIEYPEERDLPQEPREHKHRHHHKHDANHEHRRHHNRDYDPRKRDSRLEKGALVVAAAAEPVPIRLDHSKKKKRPFTWWPPIFFGTFCVIQVAMLVLMIWDGGMLPWTQNPMFGPGSDVILKWGALDGGLMRGPTWEVWRILSALVLTSGVVHLLINFIIQIALAFQIERLWAFYRIGPIFLISGLGGNLLTAMFLPFVNSIGSTPALSGMMGAMLANQLINFRSLVKPVRGLIMQLIQIALFLLIGFIPIFDNFANFGGITCGFLSGLVFVPKIQTKTKWKYLSIVVRVIGLCALIAYFLFFGALFFIFPNLDCEICRFIHPTWRDIYELINWLFDFLGITLPI